MLDLIFVVLMVMLFIFARPLFFKVLGGLVFICVIGLGISLIFSGSEIDVHKTTNEKSIEVRTYENMVKDVLGKHDKNVWDVQLYFIDIGRHDLAKKVVTPKLILDGVDVHYMSITPERISRFLMEDEKAWRQLVEFENDTRFKQLKNEHFRIILELRKLKDIYPKQ